MRILFLADGIFPVTIGGMERHSRGFIDNMSIQGVTMDIVHVVNSREQLGQLNLGQESSVQEYVLPSSVPLPGHYVRSYKKLSSRVFDDYKNRLSSYDLIYAKGLMADAFFSNENDIPVIVNLHGYETLQKSFGIKEELQKSVLRIAVLRQIKSADYVVSYGAKITELLFSKEVVRDRILEIPGAIEPGWLYEGFGHQAQRKELRLLFIGRDEIRKGFHVLEKALEDLSSFHLDVIGRNGMNSDKITYHGQIVDRDKLIPMLGRADVLVLPSLSEGMPNVILEAMASGLAIIATDVGAVSMMVDESNGRLIKPNNPGQLREAILEMHNLSPDKLKELQACSLEKVKKHFLWENVARETIKKFEGIIS